MFHVIKRFLSHRDPIIRETVKAQNYEAGIKYHNLIDLYNTIY